MSKFSMIGVQIVDDHDVVIEGLSSILQNEPGIELIKPHLQTAKNLVNELLKSQPDVLLLDVRMPEFDILEALTSLRTALPNMRVIVVTAHQDPQLVKAAAKKGAAGYILKEEALSNLLPMAVREVAGGNRWFSPKSSHRLLNAETPYTGLSEYQLDVLRMMVQGKTPNSIALSLNKSVAAVYSAQNQIREKLSLETNEQAIITAIKQRIVPLSLD